MPTNEQKPIRILAEAVALIREMESYTNEWDWPIDLGDRIEAFAKRAEGELEAKPLAEFTVDGEVRVLVDGKRRLAMSDNWVPSGTGVSFNDAPPGPVRVRIVVERGEVGQ